MPVTIVQNRRKENSAYLNEANMFLSQITADNIDSTAEGNCVKEMSLECLNGMKNETAMEKKSTKIKNLKTFVMNKNKNIEQLKLEKGKAYHYQQILSYYFDKIYLIQQCYSSLFLIVLIVLS